MFQLLWKLDARCGRLPAPSIPNYGDERTWINPPMIQNDPDYSALLALGLDTVDAQHVFFTSKHACDAFLTCDKGILRSSPAMGKLFRLVV
jgi:hypothetical protein